MKVSDLISKFNGGEWYKISKLFNDDLSTFIHFFEKKGLLDKINIEEVNRNDDDGTINQVCLLYLDKYGVDYFLPYLNDVQKGEGGYYLKIGDLTELKVLFDSGGSRGMSDEEIAEGVLGPDWFEMFSLSSRDMDFHNDVVDNLNDENLGTLREVLLDKLSGVEFDSEDFDDEWFYEHSNDEGVFAIDGSNIDEVLSESNVFNELIWTGDLSELKSELYSLYSMAYNEAWVEEVYEQIKSKISDFFDGDHTWEDKDVYFKIKNLGGDMKSYMECMSEYSDSILDVRYYLDMVKQYMTTCGEELRLYLPDYSDSDVVSKILNDNFDSYIY
jgi:hypothetical protein